MLLNIGSRFDACIIIQHIFVSSYYMKSESRYSKYILLVNFIILIEMTLAIAFFLYIIYKLYNYNIWINEKFEENLKYLEDEKKKINTHIDTFKETINKFNNTIDKVKEISEKILNYYNSSPH